MASPAEKLAQILTADPRSRVFVELGRALIEQGEHQRAADVLRSGLVHHSDSAMARVLLGRALLALGRPGEAVEPLTHALALTPADVRARQLLEQAQEAIPALPPEPRHPSPELLPLPPEPGGPVREPTGAIPLDRPLARRPPPPLPAPPRTAPAEPPPIPAPAEPPTLRNLPRPAERARDATQPGLPIDPAEAARIAARYERELREKMAADEEPPARIRRSGLLVAVLVLLAVASAATFVLVRRSLRADEARGDVTAARAGLARDTLGSLREASRALEEARALDPRLDEARSLQAQVSALLWTDYADDAALERARALAADPRAGEGRLVARYLAAPGAPERAAAAEALLSAAPGAGPLVRVLAAAILRGRGDREGARHHLEAAALATPPMLRALADLADLLRASGDADEALRLYRVALQAHPTHPRSVLGAAEVRLAQGRDLAESLKELQAMEADPASRPPGPDQLRALLLRARVQAALGQPDDAVASLAEAAGRFPGRPEVPSALAELEMARGAWDRAEVAAERAAAMAPADAAARELLARARLGRGRLRELLRETEGRPERPLRLLRAQARVELSEWERARAELEATRRDGRIPAEAAAWLALCDAATGRQAQARAILQSLQPARDQLPVAHLARGRLLAGEQKDGPAEEELRAAVAAEGAPALARVELATFLAGRGRRAEALELLDGALARNPFHAGARLARARLRLDAGDRSGAAEDARRVLEDRPGDAGAARLLAAAGAKATPARVAKKTSRGAPKKPAKANVKKPAKKKATKGKVAHRR